MSEGSKDLVIDRLKAEIEEYKAKLAQNTFDNLSQKIAELEKKVQEKDAELNDIKAASNIGGGGDANEARTRLIILQSKVRQYEQKIASLEAEKQELDAKMKRMETKSAGSDQLDVLKRQLKQEMEANEKLRTQVNQLCMEDDRDRKIKDLEIRLANAGKGGSGGVVSPVEINQLKQEVAMRDRRIADLEKQMMETPAGGAAAGGPMANVRLQREITALKSQIEMLKKNEAEMKRQYQAAMRKDEFADY